MFARIRSWFLQAQPDAPQPDWLESLTTSLARLARAQTKETLQRESDSNAQCDRLEAMDGKLKNLTTAMQHVLDQRLLANDSLVALAAAMDILDGVTLQYENDDGLADGLTRVLTRLSHVLASSGVHRIAPRGGLPDGKRFCIVGSESVEGVEEGHITRVVTSALESNGRLLREGQVVIQG